MNDYVELELICDLRKFKKQELVSIGAATNSRLGSMKLDFEENIVVDRLEFDDYSLSFCKYLNMRSSQFITVGLMYMNNLLFMDIAFSNV